MPCTCSSGYVRRDSIAYPSLMATHTPENAKCYSAYSNSYYARKAAWEAALDAIVDPACPDCVLEFAANAATIEFYAGESQDQVDYWHCRKTNG